MRTPARTRNRWATALATIALLSACGGGEDADTAAASTEGGEAAADATDDAGDATDEPTAAGEPDDDATEDGTTGGGDTDGGATEGEAGSPSGDVVAVTAVDYGYEDLPPTLTVGTSVELSNASETELHELVAIRLPDDEERSAQELVALPPEEQAELFPLVTDVLLVPPGAGADEAIAAVGDGVLDEAGRYLLICAIPTGADPVEYLTAAAQTEGGPPDVPGGPPHLAQGMWAEVEVVEG